MWSSAEDPTRIVEASRLRLTQAFDVWQQANGRAERGKQNSSSQLFLKAIVSQLDLSREEAPSRLGLPTSRSTWSSWRAGKGKATLKLRLDVCRSIMAQTGVDPTSNGFLESAPINVTDVVTMGPVYARLTGSKSNLGEKEILVDWIDFRVSGPKDVTLDQTKSNPHQTQSRFRVGSVRYALKEASIFVQSGSQLQPIATFLSDGLQYDYGKANGLELSVDRDDFSRWRAQPPFPREALQARIEALRLCKGILDDVTVGISVTKGDIEPKISLFQGEELTLDEFQNTREKLIEQVLRNRLKDPGHRQRFVLSHAKAVH